MAYSRLRCPKCDADFGQEARFLDHLTDVHGDVNYEALYVEVVLAGSYPTCGCGCGSSLTWSGWKKGYTSTFLRGHNASLDSVYLNKDRQQALATKRKEGHEAGRIKIWNVGLTKETDERVRTSAEKISASLNNGYASGSIVDWRLLNPEKAVIQAAKASATKIRLFAGGTLVAWNKGKTAKTSPEIAEIARKISETVLQNPDSSARRFKVDKLNELIRPKLELGNFKVITDLATYRNKYQRLQLLCRTCNVVQEKSLMMLMTTPKCFSCHKRESLGQLELYEFVKSLASDAVLSDRTLLPNHAEIDVLVPSHRLAIEYDGLWWHSVERQDDINRSQRKMSACKDLGLRFMVIYEDEWKMKPHIVKGMIKHRLGVSSRVLDARKLGVVQVNSKQARSFFDANHLAGHTPARVTYGLVEPDKTIVAMASLRRPFHKSHGNVFELARSCCLNGVVVRGWLGKLTKVLRDYAQEQKKDALITYVDNRIGVGAGYKAVGWQFITGDTGPRFWWTDTKKRWNRFKYKADRIRGMTQQEVADEAGVVQIFGCSNSLWRFPC